MKKPPIASRQGLTDQLREVIHSREMTAYAVGQLAGVDAGVVQRFLSGKRDILMGTADRIAAALGVRLVETARKGRPPGRGNGAGGRLAGWAPSAAGGERHAEPLDCER